MFTNGLHLIAATDVSGAIGYQNQIPWHCPSDLKAFRELTMGHSLLMGRATFESIGKPLPGRTTFVLTSKPAELPEGVTALSSLEQALEIAESRPLLVVGGQRVYEETLPHARSVVLTRLVQFWAPRADRFFPKLDPREWVGRYDRICRTGLIWWNRYIYTRQNSVSSDEHEALEKAA